MNIQISELRDSAEELVSEAQPSFPQATADDFKAVFRHHPGGVALITADDGSGAVALTATSMSSVSADPPVVVFSVSSQSSSAPTLRNAETVVVHLLDADSVHLAKLGATSGIDRFATENEWFRLPTGEPVFAEAPAWIRARVLEKVDVVGSTLIVAEAIQISATAPELLEHREGRGGLAYVNRTWHRLTPASAMV